MIREFLYVDVQRARSLLAQLEDGVVEQYVKRTALDDVGELGATIFGIGGKGTWSAQESHEESRSLKDLTFVVFEEAARAQGLIVDVDPSSDPEHWRSGSVHATLREGEVIRITGDVLITDPSYISARFAALSNFITALVEMQVESAVNAALALRSAELDGLREQMARANSGQRKQIERKLESAETQVRADAQRLVEDQLGGETGIEGMRSIMKVMTSLIGESVGVRLLSCGLDHPEMGFAGSLIGRDEYLQRERDELFSRYSSVLRAWTAVMQVAHIPNEGETTAALQMDTSSWQQLVTGPALNRAAFDKAAADLLRMMDSIGVTEGPRWPTISVVPLAIYRSIPSDFGGNSGDDDGGTNSK